MNEYKGFLMAVFAVLLLFLSFYTMPPEIVSIVLLISFILVIRGFIMHARMVNKRLFKSDDDPNP
jgi:uncharacterized membrane protein